MPDEAMVNCAGCMLANWSVSILYFKSSKESRRTVASRHMYSVSQLSIYHQMED